LETVAAKSKHSDVPVDHGARTQATVDSLGGLECVTLTNGLVQVTVLPQIGGKMASLRRTASGREFLLQPPERTYQLGSYGAMFEDFDTSGFDESLPTIATCEYPEGQFTGTVLPDHGELWSIPWKYELRDGQICLEAAGTRLPYVLRKRVAIESETVIIKYELESLSEAPFRYLWSAHPLLSIESGCRIILPSDVSRMLINSSHRSRLGSPGDKCGWPLHGVNGNRVDLSKIGSRSDCSADKLFSNRLAQGWCAMHYPSSDESICFRFDTHDVPYLGVWICQGGWPNDRAGHFTVALEPCTSSYDSLAEAIRSGECELLPPGSIKRWELRIEVKQGLPEETASRSCSFCSANDIETK
jgi:hypothetical protein